MSHITIDGIIKDWGDRLDYGRVRGRKGRNARGGRTKHEEPPPKASGTARAQLIRTIIKTPEVMVKISGGGKNMCRIKAHLDYISRNGAVALEDETGQTFLGREDLRDVRDSWAKSGIGIPYEGEKRREAFNIILSMPPGTDRQAVKDAARAFAAQEFENHQYVFAAHEDEKHPHVHLAVKASDKYGTRLNPRKADLQRWRELFAEKLREQGIEANATPRKARGIVQKTEKQAIRHMKRRGVPLSKTTRPDAKRKAGGTAARENSTQDKIGVSREKVRHVYEKVARALASGDADDRQLALQIVHFVQEMPLVQRQATIHLTHTERTPPPIVPPVERER
jgi:hypothetical protein